MRGSARYSLIASTALSVFASAAHAAPTGGVVSAGSAVINQSGALTTITQGSNRAAIDWNSFNVGASERVDFRQPSSNAITLNRIHDQNPSSILGSITANGTVILSNPSGMIFGKDSKVDVGGLVATTASLGNDAFMQGGPLKLTIPGKADSTIIANGTITAKDAGLVALLAPHVENNGIITAKLGKVQLAGAETATLDLYGDGLVSLAVTDAKETSVKHTGTIHSSWVALTAADAAHLMDSSVNVDGIIDANDAKIEKDGTLTFGGKIEITARDVTLDKNARLRAAGKNGGGVVKVGGGWQGKGTISNAKNTTIKTGARINASATDNGNGGTVAVWSDNTTQFDGTILAKGGAFGGNGGHIETSGKINLGLSGSADASSAWGTAGEWLLDPRNVIIQNNAVAGVENNVPGTGGVVNAPSDTYRISAESIGVALSAGNNVTITTGTTGTQAGNIVIGTANISSTSATDVTLTLKADGSINTTGTNSIAANGAGKLHTVFWSNANVHDSTDSGSVYLVNTTITTNGGDFHAAGGADDGADILDLAGNIKINGVAGDGRPDNYAIGEGSNSNGVRLTNADISTGTGNILAIGKGMHATGNSLYGVLVHSDAYLQTTDGNITLIGQGGPTATNNIGVNVTSISTVTSANGDIYFKGTGGGNGTNNTHFGVQVANGSTISSTGTGNSAGEIRFEGIGGTGSTAALGVGIATTTADTTTITSVDGDIWIEGHAGTVTESNAYGVHLNANGDLGGRVIISSTGNTNNAAKITIKGYGGTGGTTNVGFRAEDDSLITSAYGNIDIYGKAGSGSSDRHRGIFIYNNSGIESTGTGPDAATITIVGIGGTGTDKNTGVEFQIGSYVKSVDGDISIHGTGGSGTAGTAANYGIYLSDYITTSFAYVPTPNNITATGDANITLTSTPGSGSVALQAEGNLGHTISTSTGGITFNTDSLSLPHTNISTAGTVSFVPKSTATDTGVAGAPGALQINSQLLDKVTAGNIIIGRADSIGQINLGSHTWDDPVEFKTGSGLINLMGNQTGIPGSDAAMTFSGPARTYYDIDFTGTTGTGVTFNGSRDVKTGGGASGGGSDDSATNPPPAPPASENPETPMPPPAAPSAPQLPADYMMNTTLISAVVSQDTNAKKQVEEDSFDFGSFYIRSESYFINALYSMDPELEKTLGQK